jgi:peptidoglycan hydrolase-like protein with peptidoglycan-binding domain
MIGLGIAFLVALALMAASGGAKAKPGTGAGAPPSDLGPVVPGPPDPKKPTATTKGKSGTSWITQAVGTNAAGTIYVDVFLPDGQLGSHPTYRVLRYAQPTSGSRQFMEAAAGIDPKILAMAVLDFSLSTSTGPVDIANMSAELQKRLSDALSALTVGTDGKVVGPVSASAIQFATTVAGELERAGFGGAATALRAYIKAAATLVPAPPPGQHIPLPATMPDDLKAQFQRAMQLERDPAKLTAILNALKAYQPQTSDLVNAEQMLSALIVQVQAQQSAADALNKIQKVVAPPAMVVPSPSGYLRQGSVGPDVAAWQRIIGAKPDGIFGPQTTAMTKAWQSAHGLKPDGVVGPKTLAAARADAAGGQPAGIPAVSPTGHPTIKQGSRGAAVAEWQGIIGAKPDGIFGPNTASLTKQWQSAHGLNPDGIVGPKTWSAAMGVAAPSQGASTYTAPQGLPDSPSTVPPVPVPGAAPQPKSPVEIAADAMVRNLKAVQGTYGMPGAKGKEDLSIVKRFQSAAGTTADGKTGAGTLVLAAINGQSDLPLVMYWPKVSSAANVLKYRSDLNDVAARAYAAGDLSGAANLQASAAREHGEGKISSGQLVP